MRSQLSCCSVRVDSTRSIASNGTLQYFRELRERKKNTHTHDIKNSLRKTKGRIMLLNGTLSWWRSSLHCVYSLHVFIVWIPPKGAVYLLPPPLVPLSCLLRNNILQTGDKCSTPVASSIVQNWWFMLQHLIIREQRPLFTTAVVFTLDYGEPQTFQEFCQCSDHLVPHIVLYMV